MSKKEEHTNEQPRLTIETAPEEQEAYAQEQGAGGEEQENGVATHEEQEPRGKEQEGAPSLKEAIREQAIEDEAPLSKNFTLRKILGGDILTTTTIRRQLWVLVLVTVFIIIYISNRYSCQQSIIEIDRLQRELQDAKYRALSSNSLLTEQCRQSHVLEILRATGDSTLHIANQPPYIIKVPAHE